MNLRDRLPRLVHQGSENPRIRFVIFHILGHGAKSTPFLPYYHTGNSLQSQSTSMHLRINGAQILHKCKKMRRQARKYVFALGECINTLSKIKARLRRANVNKEGSACRNPCTTQIQHTEYRPPSPAQAAGHYTACNHRRYGLGFAVSTTYGHKRTLSPIWERALR